MAGSTRSRSCASGSEPIARPRAAVTRQPEPPFSAVLPAAVRVEPEAVSISTAVQISGVGRTRLYAAMSTDPGYRGGMPLLTTFKVGRRRLIRLAALKAWLAEIEALPRAEA